MSKKKAYLYITTDAESSGIKHVELFHDIDSLKARAKEEFEGVVESVFDETGLKYEKDGSIDYDDDVSGYTYDGIGTWTVVSESDYEYSSFSGEVIEIMVSGPDNNEISISFHEV